MLYFLVTFLGLIISLLTSRKISKGEELFVDYGYDPKESHNDVEWYFEQVLHYILGVFLNICDT
jgi:hypothetical protein